MTDVPSLRVVRPYATEEAFLEAEAWTITTRSVLLVDVAPHPEGTIVRVELGLSSGLPLIVAEGAVVKHLCATESRPAGLVVRFRRMSAQSSEFVQRATSNASRIPSLNASQTTVSVPNAQTSLPSSRRDEPRRAQSVSVIPQARRHSTLPPSPEDRALVAPTPTLPSRKPIQAEHPADAPTSLGSTPLNPDVMARLRNRTAQQQPITVPPDRETILARLKKP